MTLPAERPTTPPVPTAADLIAPGGPPPVRQTIATAARLVSQNRQQILLPLAIVQAPVALLIAAVTAALYLTVFSGKAEVVPPGVLGTGDSDQIFVALILTAVEGLFTLVARGASIVAIAGAARGRSVSLTQALDPAFTRLGGLLLIIAISAVAVGIAALTVIGLPLAFFAAIRFALVFDAFMIEELGVVDSFKRSWRLTRRNMLRLLAVAALSALIVLPAVFVFSLLSGITADSRTAEVLLVSGAAVVQSILLIPLVAFATATTTLFYLRLKANSDARTTA